MSLKKINLCPRFSQHLVTSRVFEQKPIVVVDVGARRGFEGHWSIYGDQVRLIGFEPDAEECEQLNRQDTNTNNRFFPIALGEEREKKIFHVTAHESSCGFYPPDMELMRRFVGGEENLSIVKTEEMDTVDFDSFAAEHGIGHFDFMKLDTEGSELDILKGAIGLLRKSVIGLSLEVEFLQMHRDQPLFTDVDSFMRSNGFALFDLEIYRIEKRALPALTIEPIPGSPVEKGQIVSGDALYLRDGVKEIVSSGPAKRDWNDISILKLASLMELFCLPDCAVELLQVSRRKGYLNQFNVDYLIELLVPSINGRNVSYKVYLEKIELVKQRGYVNNTDRFRKLAIQCLSKSVRKRGRNFLTTFRDVVDRIL